MEKVIEELESRICDLAGHETLGIFGKEAEGPLMTAGDLQTIFAELSRTKTALETIRAMEIYMQDGDVGSLEFMRDFYRQKFRDAISYAKSGLLGRDR